MSVSLKEAEIASVITQSETRIICWSGVIIQHSGNDLESQADV